MNINEGRINLVNLIRNYKSSTDIEGILNSYSIFIDNVMQERIPNIDLASRIRLKNEIIDYIRKSVEKGYTDNQSIKLFLERLVNATFDIGEIKSGTFGLGSIGHVAFNFSNEEFRTNMKHYVFHELTHSVTNLGNHLSHLTLGTYKKVPRIMKKIESEQRIKFLDGLSPEIKEPILSTSFITFLYEIMAEATACDLANSYKREKVKAWAASANIKTDWHTPYNQQYQELGYKFIKTFLYPNDSNQNERVLFKKITIEAINNLDFGEKILEFARQTHPESYKEDLHELSTLLGDICDKHSVTEETVQRINILIAKYSTMTLTKRTSEVMHLQSRWVVLVRLN